MENEYVERIQRLRDTMAESGVDAVIIPQTDPHQSEYIADHWEVRRYLSGFTGSAGTLVVTATQALMWVDSRYFLQAASQLQGTGIEMMKIAIPGTPSIEAWLSDNLRKDQTVGIDGMLFSVTAATALRDVLTAYSLKLRVNFDVVDRIWPDRPALPKDKIFVHPLKYAGQSAAEKIDNALTAANALRADSVFISALDEIAWILNIRCSDVEYNPVATAYLYVSSDSSTLFIDSDKLSPEISAYLAEQGVGTARYTSVKNFLSALPANEKVLIEPERTSVLIAEILGERAVMGSSPVAVPKARRNAIQIEGTRQAMVRDGVALVYSFMEIERRLAAGETVTEMEVARILRRHRSVQPLFFDESFATIAGYGPHGAIVHYEADEDSDAVIEPHGLLLVDSGAQYLDGTTDITRTVALGMPTPEEMHDFTLVMKGNIALSTMVFPEGTLGVQLDAEARKFLWREGLTYLHGTGHGVGHFLNVHEGPQTIRMNPTPVPLMEGMITSNEPGLYRENVHGVRCENLELCVPAMTTDFGVFLKFETVTLFPFDRCLFETSIMSPEEISWVDSYHSRVYADLAPSLDEEGRQWLADKTRPLPRP